MIRSIGHVFSSDPAVLDAFERVGPFLALAFFLFGVAGVMAAVLLAQARPTIVSLATVLCKWCIDLPFSLVLLLHSHRGLPAIWWGMSAGNGALAVLLTIIVVRTSWPQEVENARRRSEAKRAQRPSEARPLLQSPDDEEEWEYVLVEVADDLPSKPSKISVRKKINNNNNKK